MRSGILAEFDTPEALASAVQALVDRGYHTVDAYAPYPLHEVERALGLKRSRLPLFVFPMAILGTVFGYWVQWYTNAVDYPLNVGSRPVHAPPAFVIITFETCILFSALATVIGLFIAMRLPELWHPVFEVPGFERASIDRFWLGVDATDKQFNRGQTPAELIELGAMRVLFTPDGGTPEGAPAPAGGTKE
jgi:hypothetical protein